MTEQETLDQYLDEIIKCKKEIERMLDERIRHHDEMERMLRRIDRLEGEVRLRATIPVAPNTPRIVQGEKFLFVSKLCGLIDSDKTPHTAVELNQALESEGYIVRKGKDWDPTEKGGMYCQRRGGTNPDGRTWSALAWNPVILTLLGLRGD